MNLKTAPKTPTKTPSKSRTRYVATNGISPPDGRYEIGDDVSNLPHKILSRYLRTGDVRKES